MPDGTVVKNPPVNAGDHWLKPSLIPGLGRSPGGGNGNPLQYSCLGNPMDQGAWQATVQRIAKTQTRLSNLTTTTKKVRCLQQPHEKGFVLTQLRPLRLRQVKSLAHTDSLGRASWSLDCEALVHHVVFHHQKEAL